MYFWKVKFATFRMPTIRWSLTRTKTSIKRRRCFFSKIKRRNVAKLRIWRGQGPFKKLKNCKHLLKAISLVRENHSTIPSGKWLKKMKASMNFSKTLRPKMSRDGLTSSIWPRSNKRRSFWRSRQRCAKIKWSWWRSSVAVKIWMITMI